MKILLVDDEAHVLEGLEEAISWKDLGFHTLYFAETGSEAWMKYREYRPDLLVTDMHMPDMDGIGLIRQIREENPVIPIIILTGYEDFNYTQQAIHLGVTRYILKPSLPEEIEKEIKSAVAEMRHKRKEKQLMNDIRQKYDHSLPILREHFIYQMITTAGVEINEQKLVDLGMDAEVMRCGAVASVKILYPAETDHLKMEWPLYQFAVGNIVREIASNHGRIHVLRNIENSLFIFIYGSSANEIMSKTRRTSAQVIQAINNYLKLDVNIGIGNPYTDVQKYPQSLKESKEALHVCEMESMNQYQLFQDLDLKPKGWPQYPAEDIQALCESFRMLNSSEVGHRWSVIKEILLNGPHTPLTYMQTMCISIFSYLYMQIIESDHLKIDPQHMSGMMEQIYTPGSKEELIRLMEDQIHSLLEKLIQHNSTKSYVSAVKSVIEKRYSEKISFAQLARELKINRNYLSNLFKKESGLSFIHYLTNYRINKAKELLVTKEYMVYEVAEMVGYQDPAYFSRMFKNITGYTPLQFITKNQ